MVGLVPNIYLLQYLEGTDQKEPELEEKAKEFMRIGYRRQAKYRHNNGAYSIWGDKGDKDGSSWLTAFVVKAFSQAAAFISIDEQVVQRSVNWLMEQQEEGGCFKKRGYVHSSYLKGGGSDSSLTPFIVTALVEAATSKEIKIKVNSKKLGDAVNCMMKSLNTSELYSSVVTANSMNLAVNKFKDTDMEVNTKINDPKIQEQLANLMSTLALAANTTTPGSKFWASAATPRTNYWWQRASSEEVEMTAYMVLSLVLRGEEEDALEAVKWLGRQRNSRGGFVSTQDTVVALQALSLYSQRVTRLPLDMKVTMTEADTQLGVFSLQPSNALVLQSQAVTKLPAALQVETKGSGCAMVQTVLRYNTPQATHNSGFGVRAQLEGGQLEVCGEYTGGQQQTGMVVVEVEMLTGWEAVDPESLANEVTSDIQRVERDKDDQDKVVLYFDSWPRQERCVQLRVKQVMKVTEAKPAVVTIYDYYKTEDKASVLYTAEK